MKQAQIKCPHCGESIIVRQSEIGDAPPEALAAIWKAAEEAFDEVDKAFKKIFDPKNWKW